jgi:ribonuclease HII
MLSLYMGDDVNEVQAGIDEAGRGCFAGPVVAAAVVWDNQWLIDHKDVYKELSDIKDSKKLSEKKRKTCFEFIRQHAYDWEVTFVDNQTIDQVNILNATYQAMHGALDGLDKACVDRILVDGSNFKTYISKKENQFSIPHQCVTGGDNKYLSIAAASILAKVWKNLVIKRNTIGSTTSVMARATTLKVSVRTGLLRSIVKPLECVSTCDVILIKIDLYGLDVVISLSHAHQNTQDATCNRSHGHKQGWIYLYCTRARVHSFQRKRV